MRLEELRATNKALTPTGASRDDTGSAKRIGAAGTEPIESGNYDRKKSETDKR